MGLVLSVSAALIIPTNLLVAAALLKLLLKRGCQSWCFVLNLALADTLVGVAITGLATEDFSNSFTHHHYAPLVIYNSTNTSQPAPPGKTRCLLRMAFLTSPCVASISSMFLISLDRYIAIKLPLHYSLMSGRGKTVGFLLALWIGSFTTGFLPVMVHQLQAVGPYDGFCAFFNVTHDITIIILYCALFFPLLSLFIFMYLDILKIACIHHKQISQIRQMSSRAEDSHHGPSQYHHHPQHHLLRSWSHVKALKTVLVLVGCFLVLWSPFFVVCIVHLLCRRCALKEVLENYLWLLGLLNSLINPLVYACWQREVRLQLSAMFSCITSRLLSEAAPSVMERGHSSPPAHNHACVSEGDTPSPSIRIPISSLDAQAVHFTDTTSL
ncbi:glucose-dependent insulinotropic receptor isoform X2 [Cyprinodon tularosa]|uniref:glucose-dependent insulinotropic receptor isoform X1 n=1 Tax=Cyprinodon tularosa TaxID=77115 RepID=UPI0018E223BF|nr:glucose-dependent insulinotropic receptor isoform X1 [Cyprinodon tularosa]XP_038155565.1 glucose-dependent insulinotropic receptor isoform X2 [Cyprinodon tularosa]